MTRERHLTNRWSAAVTDKVPTSRAGRRLVVHELYPSKEALDAAGTGAQEAMRETFGQLDEILWGLAAA